MRYDSDQSTYVFRWRHARQGQRCRIVEKGERTVKLLFPDGETLIVNRAAIRRDDAMRDESKQKQQPGQPQPDEPDTKDEEEGDDEEGDEQDQDQEQPKVEGNKGSQHGQTH